ncbi:MAG TPA: hypothetical protein EYP25_02535 [Anaerolineae bacterium]|nr:hypothetical protein [Caldilineae bacterium]HID33440.1 hypothetical protein [Anaerolineae bacterium]
MLLILGLDGADWRILDPWLREGRLPALAELKARSRWSGLQSTIRPESSVAWSTFATGVNPGKHGIFGFAAQQPESYEVRLNTAASVRATPFWRQVATAGQRLALFNAPMTYPPAPMPGAAVVAGMLTPDTRSPFTQPPDLRERLLAAVPDYVINVERTGMALGEFIRATRRAIQARGRAARWLLAQADWDAFVAVFTATDRLQHYTLHLLHPDHPRYDAAVARRLLPELLAAYQALDEAVAGLVGDAGEEATVILLSDHGFSPVARAFYVNVFLEREGWLVWKRRPDERSGLWRRLRRHPSLRRLKRGLPGLRDMRRPPPPAAWLHAIDWTRTRAVYSPAGGIRFNIRDREPQGIVEPAAVEDLIAELSDQLRTLCDPLTGHSPIQRIFRREALYHGPWLHLAPDLILEPRRDDPNPGQNTLLRAGYGTEPFADTRDLTGNHALRGILAAAGPGIPAGEAADARLMDLAPTILHLLGLPAAESMDGRALDFAPGEVQRWDEAPATAADAGLTPDDQRLIQDRLRGLGYLDD